MKTVRRVPKTLLATVCATSVGVLPVARVQAGELPSPVIGTAISDAHGEYHPLAPQRVLDTRTGLGRSGVAGKIGEGESIVIPLAGVGGVPLTGVEAVVVNVTATNSTAAGFLTLWATGQVRHDVSNVNFAAGQTVPNLVTVSTNALGQVSLFNDRGATDVVVDLAGYYSSADGARGDRFVATTPRRVLDTRNGIGAPPHRLGTAPIDLVIDPPATGDTPTAVALDVTVVGPSDWSFLTVFPAGRPQPDVSNLNYVAGETVANQVIVALPPSGRISLVNEFGTTDVLVDVVGYYHHDETDELGRYIPFVPFRWFDSRVDTGAFGGKIPSGQGLVIGPDDTWARAYVMNVTVTGPESAGYVTAFPTQVGPPMASVLNFTTGQTVANHVIVGSSPNSEFDITGGPTHLIIDVYGAFT